MINWTKRLLLTCTILGLLATNVLTLISTAFNADLSGFMSTALGVATVTEALNTKIAKQDQVIKKRKAVASKFGNRLAVRTLTIDTGSEANAQALMGALQNDQQFGFMGGIGDL
jgi:hypothetical protein